MLEALVQATEEYVVFLSTVEQSSAAEKATRLLAQLALVMPDEVEYQITGGHLLDAPDLNLPPGAGERFISWWRRQDPLPASEANERLLEHVQRVQHAEAHFTSTERPTGFDDRGEIYVRYGRPERERIITFDDPEFVDKIYDFGMVMNLSDFPENVFWRYGHIDGTGQFLFIEKDGEYQLGTASELLPRPLRTGFTPYNRGQRRAEMAMAAMQTIYRQLAHEDPAFLNRYSQVDNYISDREGPGRLAERVLGEGFRRNILDQDDDTELQPGGSGRPPSEVVQSVIVSARTEDQQMVYQRSLLMPDDYTEVYRTLPFIPMSARFARFLEKDGQTRTELYWGSSSGSVKSRAMEENILFHLTVVRKNAEYEQIDYSTQSTLVDPVSGSKDIVVTGRQHHVCGDEALYHLALQWDIYRGGKGSNSQDRIGVGTVYFDSLTALDGSRERLEVSDLKPMMVWYPDEEPGDSDSYPYMQVDTELPLGLFFEIYNLKYDETNYSRYRVTYRISLRDMEGRRRKRRSPTSVATTHAGTRLVEQQEILLDLSDWKEAGPVEVMVTVQDLITGSRVTRSIDFVLI